MEIHEGEVILRPITIADCTADYLGWMNDPQVSRYLETRWREHTLADIQSFVRDMNESTHSHLLAIIHAPLSRHIGNLKIGPVNTFHRYADLSYFIGERAFWGKGLATQAIRAACRFGFDELELDSIQAGVYGKNIGSARALEKAGFSHVGTIPHRFISGDDRDDHLLYHLPRGGLKRE